MDAEPKHNAELTEEDLLSFVTGEASPALKKRIAEEMEKDGSFAQKWLSRLQSTAVDPFNVDWAALLDSDALLEESERKRNKHKRDRGTGPNSGHGRG